jgi:hypothetical protein
LATTIAPASCNRVTTGASAVAAGRVGEHVRPGPGRQPGHVEQVLDPDRDPVQRPAPLAARQLVGQLGRPHHRRIGVQRDHRVVRVRFQPLQHVADVLHRRQLARSQRRGQLAQGDHPPTLPPPS